MLLFFEGRAYKIETPISKHHDGEQTKKTCNKRKRKNTDILKKVAEVVRRSQRLPLSKIDTPISVQADNEQTKKSCKSPKRKITEISKKLPRLFGGVRSYHRAK